MKIDVEMEIDIEKYTRHLDGCDMTEEQKIQYIQSLSEILKGFVYKAFDPNLKS